MSSIDVSIASERQMRKREAEFVNSVFVSEMIPLIVPSDSADGSDGSKSKASPFVYAKDLPALVVEFLEQHYRHGNLTWHNGMIPDTEIWIKIGGDKGGGTMKMFFQIVNINNPNAGRNTVTFASFAGPDTPDNMTATMEQYEDQIKALENMSWRGYSFRLSFFGDCELLCKMYGILSCNSVYACPVCEEPKHGWKIPLKERKRRKNGLAPLRTNASLHRNFLQYMSDGCRPNRSKTVSKSVVRLPLFPIEPQQITMPTLHISIGVHDKIYRHLEEGCHDIDKDIFTHLVKTYDDSSIDKSSVQNNFDQAVQQRVDEVGEKHTMLDKKNHDLAEMTANIQDTSIKEICAIQQKITELEGDLKKADFKKGTGPITSALDDVLQRHNIQRQEYHGKTFNGNQVKKCCQPSVTADLAGTPHRILGELDSSHSDTAVPLQAYGKATEVAKCFATVMAKFSRVHKCINHGRNMTEQEILDAETAIEDFMQCFRSSLANVQISLKLHFLEDHVLPQIKSLRAGLGLMNEQGGENQHGHQKREAAACSNLKHQPMQQLLTVMKNSLTQCLPDVQAKMLHRKKRQNED
ncbi:uncharacterized protein [Amphiura filiformis]|uniref:uncharacterized protein n=1 Tax=Amphiura filiformis TaxID=82378 RepID=UPI003B212132